MLLQPSRSPRDGEEIAEEATASKDVFMSKTYLERWGFQDGKLCHNIGRKAYCLEVVHVFSLTIYLLLGYIRANYENSSHLCGSYLSME